MSVDDSAGAARLCGMKQDSNKREVTAAKDGRVHKPLGHALWFKDVISSVLAHSLAAAVPVLLPAAKLLLLGVVLLPMLGHPIVSRLPVTYSGGVLLLVGTLQNMALTD